LQLWQAAPFLKYAFMHCHSHPLFNKYSDFAGPTPQLKHAESAVAVHGWTQKPGLQARFG
jgi:hypothetical protein